VPFFAKVGLIDQQFLFNADNFKFLGLSAAKLYAASVGALRSTPQPPN
jgi:hypothetical protein